MSLVKPITPKQARVIKVNSIPELVLEIFNEEIKKHLDSCGRAIVWQDDVVKAILARYGHTISRQDIFDTGLLDVEPIYRQAGWKVTYNKPGYNETYKAAWTFS